MEQLIIAIATWCGVSSADRSSKDIDACRTRIIVCLTEDSSKPREVALADCVSKEKLSNGH